MPNVPAYDATYALSQLLRTQALSGTPTKQVDATTAFSAALVAAPTQGVTAPSPIATSAGPQTPSHTFRVEPLTAPKDDKKDKRK